MGKERVTVFLSRGSADIWREVAKATRASAVTGCAAGQPSMSTLLEYMAAGIKSGAVRVPGVDPAALRQRVTTE